MDGIWVHASDIRITYKYIWVTHGWHTSTYDWHTDDMRVYTSDIRITYEHIRVTYGWHTSTYKWHTDDIRVHTSDLCMTYEWYTSTYDLHANDIRNIKLHNGFGAFRSLFLTICFKNTALCWCKRFLVTGSFLFSCFWLEYSPKM